MGKKPLTPGRISKLASNPGTRAALVDKFLTPAQLRQRQLNQRLNTPVTPGSSLTNRDLAHQRSAATTVEYGAADQALGAKLAGAQQQQKDQASWYQQYQDQVNKLRGDIANNSDQAVTQAQGLTSAVGQLGKDTAVGTGSVADDASKASAIRQALSASFGAMMASKGTNAKNYADQLADVVVPGQKLTALNQSAKDVGSVRDQIAALAREKGAYGSKFMSDTVANEQKNVLANQALTGKTAAEQAANALKAAGLSETTRSHKANENIKKQSAAQKVAADAAKINQYGYTASAWSALTTAQRQAEIKRFKQTGKTSKTAPASGPGSLPPATEANRVSLINKVYDALRTGKVQVKDPVTGAVSIRRMKPEQVRDQFQAQHMDPHVLNTALSLFHNNGKLGKFGVREAQHAGVHVNGNWEIVG